LLDTDLNQCNQDSNQWNWWFKSINLVRQYGNR